MRIIIDTNIFIPLEDSDVFFQEQHAEFARLISGTHQLIIHPASIKDIKRDKDETRKQSMLQRIQGYNHLENHPTFNEGEEEVLFGLPKNENDQVDNLILFAMIKNCAHVLVTEDHKLLKKAKIKGFGDRVLTVAQACELLGQEDASVDIELVNIKDVFCHELDLENDIFDSLRGGYSGFNSWFERSAQDGRKAWISGSLNDIHAICIYKEEEDEVVTKENVALSGKLLKLCTLKVNKNGVKLGELLIKQAFDYACLNNKDYVYLTVDEVEHSSLVELISDFGFSYFGVDQKGRDSVYVKSFFDCNKVELPLVGDKSALEFNIKYYPAVDARTAKAYLVPIQPIFHERLFPDLIEEHPQQLLFPKNHDSVGNAIKQAYICRTQTTTVEPGDLVFFYCSHDKRSITTYGVVEQMLVGQDTETIFNLVKRRTVYTIDEIQEKNGDLKAKAILFRRIRHLEKTISITRLIELGIVSAPFQSLLKLDLSKLNKLVNEAGINDCFLPD